MHILRHIATTAAFCGTLAGLGAEAEAGPRTTIKAVEVTVVIEADGTTTVDNRVSFNVAKGTGPMTALIVENMALTPTDFGPARYELADSKQASKVIITKTGYKEYDLEAVPKIPDGDAYLFFRYTGNMFLNEYIGITNNAEKGELYYFDWAPMQWENALQYRDVKIVLPVPVSGPEISDADFQKIAGYSRSSGYQDGSKETAQILTERKLNARNRIDYIGTDVGGGQYRLTMHVFQEIVSAREAQRIQFYMKPELVPFHTELMKTSQSTSDEDDQTRSLLDEQTRFEDEELPIGIGIGIILVVGAAGIGIMAGSRKRREEELQRVLDGQHTAADDMWEAPELLVGSHGKGAKVAQNLHPVEIGLLLGMEIPQIIGILVQAMADDGKLVVQSLEPIRAMPAADATFDDDIESNFAGIFDETGNIEPSQLNAFLEAVVTRLQEKTWDCDLDATRKYYLDLLYENPDETDPTKLRYKYIEDRVIETPDAATPSDGTDRDEYVRRRRSYWRHYNGYYTHSYHFNHGLPKSYSVSYAAFLQSAACFHGCFQQPNLENVCHSACHSACHDACHDACHSACHSACHHVCHSACHHACHSACVSGRSR